MKKINEVVEFLNSGKTLKKKELKKIAKEIVRLEKNLSLDKNDKESLNKIQNIMLSLSLLEMFQVDEYIQKNKDKLF